MVNGVMDICQNIKIKCERQDEITARYALCLRRYLVGTMVKKGNSSKKIPMNFECPRIVLIYGNIEAEDLAGVRTTSFIAF